MRLVVHNDSARLDASALVVGNHVSWLDIYTVNAWRPTPFVSKAEVRQWPVVGWLAEKLDTVFLQREKRTEAMRVMHEMAERLRNGMCVFPEGTTTDGQELLPFHANLFQAAVSAGCAVQPICLMYEDAHGRQSVAPASRRAGAGHVARHGVARRPARRAPSCEPIAPGGDRRATSAAARDAIAAALAKLQEKVGKPTAESLAELAKHAYPATEVGAGAAGHEAADAPVPGREG